MIENFFKIFCVFVKADLIESFNKRNIRIIYLFFMAFYNITSKKFPQIKNRNC